MSYPLSSPISVIDSNPVTVNFTNTSSAENWTASTTASDQLQFASTSDGSVLTLYPAGGQAEAKIFRLVRGANTVSLNTDSSLGATYNYNFPAQPPTGDGQIIASSSGASTNVFYDIHATSVFYVRKNPGPNEFSSIASAVAAAIASTPSASNKCVIQIFSGTYSESAITLPAYVFLWGQYMESVVITPSALGYPLITIGGPHSGMSFLSIRDTDPLFPAVWCLDCGDSCILHKVELKSGCAMGVLCETSGSATANSQVYLEYFDTTGSTTYALKVIDTNPASTFGNYVSCENFFSFEHSDNAVICSGLNSYLIFQATELSGDGLGTAVLCENGCRCDMRGVYMENWALGISVPNDGTTVTLYNIGPSFIECTQNINIASSTTIGFNDGFTEYSKTSVPFAAPFFITNTDQHIITVAQKGADFTSVAAANNFITGSSSSNRFSIEVGPGMFIEPPFTIKDYVAIRGNYQTSTVLVCSTPASNTFITGGAYSSISQVTLTTGYSYPATPPSGSVLLGYHGNASGFNFRVDNVILDSAETLITADNAVGPGVLILTNIIVNMQGNFKHGVVLNTDSSLIKPLAFLFNNVYWSPQAQLNFIDFYSFTSAATSRNLVGELTNVTCGKTTPAITGTGVTISGSCNIVMNNTLFSGLGTGLSIPNTTYNPNILLDTTTFYNTVDINIQNPNTLGAINCIATEETITILSNNIGVIINDPDGEIVLSGQIKQGTGFSQITNITEQIQHGSVLGTMNPDPIITTSGLDATTPAGIGYVMIGSFPTDYLKFITYTSQTITLPADKLSWLYIDNTGTLLSSLSQPDYITTIILGAVKMGSSAVEYIQNIERHGNHIGNQIDNYNRMSFGNVFSSGCLGSPGSSGMKLSVSSGSYWYSVDNFLPPATTDITMIGYYRDGSGGYITTSLNSIPLEWDDNSGTLQTLTGSEWAKPSIFVVGDNSGGATYIFIYPQEIFSSNILAVAGPLPLQPSFITGNVCPIIAVVTNGADTVLLQSNILDIRPVLGFVAQSNTTTLDHNSLLNLSVGNYHPQYFRVDGTATMSGNMNLGFNNIYNSTSIALYDSVSTNSITLQPPASLAAAYNFTLPPNGGTLGYVLSTDGAGTTSWISAAASGTPNAVPNTIMTRDGSAETHVAGLYYDTPSQNILVIPIGTLSANRTYTLPDVGGASTFLMNSSTGGQTLSGNLALSSLTASLPLKLNASKNIISQLINLTTDVSGILPIANGGSGSSSLTPFGVVSVNSGGTSLVSNPLTNGQLLIGSTGAAPVAATLIGTTNQIIVNNGAGFINLATPQDIATISQPLFDSATLGINNTLKGSYSLVVGDTNFLQAFNSACLGQDNILRDSDSTFKNNFQIGQQNVIDFGSSSDVYNNLQLGSFNTFSTVQTKTWNNIQLGNYSDVTSENTDSQFAIIINANQPDGASSFYSGGLCRNLTGSNGINIHGANIYIGADPSGFVTFLDVCPSTGVAPTSGNDLTNLTYVNSGVATLTNKSMSGLSNTFTNIPNSALVNSSITLTSGTGITVTGSPVSLGGSATIALTTPVTIANGGTNTTSFSGNGLVYANPTGTTLISSVLTNGQLLIGSTGAAPNPSTITGTTNRITVTNGAGSITLSTPQDIATGSSPTFASETLTNTTNQLTLGTTNTTTISSVPPAASRTYTIQDAGGNDTFTMNAATQTLTNKTLTAVTNTIRATQLATTGADVIVNAAVPPTTGQVLAATSATNATWQSLTSLVIPAHITINTNQLTVSGTGVVTVSYYPWKNSIYGTYNTRTVSMWVTPSSNRNLVVNVLPTGGASIGSITITAGSATGIYTFTFTNPGADRRLDFTVTHATPGGNNSLINGIAMELT